MFTWKDYYVENERRHNQIDEAKQACLKKAFLTMKESRLRKSGSRIRSKHIAHNHELSYEVK
jgi:hypothetical protein